MDFLEVGEVSGLSDPALEHVKVGDTIDGEYVHATIRHLTNGVIKYNFITDKSLTKSNVEKY
jgi:hypothetical protein